MFVGHGEGDLIDFGVVIEDALAHGVKRLLYGEAVVVGEGFEKCLANAGVKQIPVRVAQQVWSQPFEHGRQDAVGCIGERCVAVDQESAKRGASGLEKEQVRKARLDLASAARAGDRRCALGGESGECVGVSAAAGANSFEGLLGDADERGGNMSVMLEEVAGERGSEFFDRIEDVLLGQGEGDVLHGVGGDDQAVVAAGVGFIEIPLECDIDRELADVVTVVAAGDLGQPDLRLAVGMMRENGGHDAAAPLWNDPSWLAGLMITPLKPERERRG